MFFLIDITPLAELVGETIGWILFGIWKLLYLVMRSIFFVLRPVFILAGKILSPIIWFMEYQQKHQIKVFLLCMAIIIPLALVMLSSIHVVPPRSAYVVTPTGSIPVLMAPAPPPQ